MDKMFLLLLLLLWLFWGSELIVYIWRGGAGCVCVWVGGWGGGADSLFVFWAPLWPNPDLDLCLSFPTLIIIIISPNPDPDLLLLFPALVIIIIIITTVIIGTPHQRLTSSLLTLWTPLWRDPDPLLCFPASRALPPLPLGLPSSFFPPSSSRALHKDPSATAVKRCIILLRVVSWARSRAFFSCSWATKSLHAEKCLRSWLR